MVLILCVVYSVFVYVCVFSVLWLHLLRNKIYIIHLQHYYYLPKLDYHRSPQIQNLRQVP